MRLRFTDAIASLHSLFVCVCMTTTHYIEQEEILDNGGSMVRLLRSYPCRFDSINRRRHSFAEGRERLGVCMLSVKWSCISLRVMICKLFGSRALFFDNLLRINSHRINRGNLVYHLLWLEIDRYPC